MFAFYAKGNSSNAYMKRIKTKKKIFVIAYTQQGQIEYLLLTLLAFLYVTKKTFSYTLRLYIIIVNR